LSSKARYGRVGNKNRGADMRVFQGVLPFKLVVTNEDLSHVTAHAGVPLIVEAMRRLIPTRLYRRLRKALGYKRWPVVRRHVESIAMLLVAGGNHVSDIEVLRADEGLSRLVGFEASCATQLKEFLYRFHQAVDGQRLTRDDDFRLAVRGEAKIRPEGPGLRLLEMVNAEVVRRIQRDRQCRRATVDVDATIIEAWKRLALKSYEGIPGYQPQMAWWAEQSVWIADEFRDGNVPAEFQARAFLIRAFAALPGSVVERRLRADSALYNEDALTWADDNGIQFAVSADMSPSLREKTQALPDDAWKPYRTLKAKDKEEETREERQWAEVADFVPEWRRNRRKDGKAFRYIAIRVRSRQRDLLMPDDNRWRHFAVVTNMDWEGERLLRWQREKQGTVEHGHGVLKNEFAGGTMPCGRFGANAAWWRLNVLVHNLTQLLKVRSLPPEMASLRPKALRFRIFNVVGVLVGHARRLAVRISDAHPYAQILGQARQAILDMKYAARAGPLPAA
jgi:hypothetical protein